MRIVHVEVYHHPPLGYASFYLPYFQQRLGHEVCVVTSDRYAPFPDYERTMQPILGPRHVGATRRYERDLLTYRLPGIGEWRNRLWMRGFSRLMGQLGADVIHAHDAVTFAPFQCARVAGSLGCPLVITSTMEHEVVQNRTLSGRALYGAFSATLGPAIRRHTSLFCGVSEGACLVLEEVHGIAREKIALIPLGAAEEIFSFDEAGRSEIRTRLGVPGGGVVVLYAGKLIPSKDAHILVDAWCHAKVPNMWLVLVGNGAPDYVATLRARVPPELADRLVMLPPVPNPELPKYFSAADIGVWPSESSNAAIEAAVLGLPIVVSDDLCSRHYVSDGNGTTFRRGDVSGLAGVLERLAGDPGLRARQRDVALRVVRPQRSWTGIAGRYLSAYTTLLRR